MKAPDTNVLVRFLVKDDEQQANTVYEMFKNAEMKKESFFIPVLVVLETIWVSLWDNPIKDFRFHRWAFNDACS